MHPPGTHPERTGTSSGMTKKSILVVEDDVHFGKQIVDLFGFLGYSTELVANGKTAVTTFQNGRFDLILSDLMLPEQNGVDLVKAVRKMPHGAQVPIFMMSAVYRNPKLFQRELKDLEIIEFLAKPFSIVDLGRRVGLVLGTDTEPIDDSAMTASGSWSSVELRSSLGEGYPQFDLEGDFDRLSLLKLFIDIFDNHHPGELTLKSGRATRRICFLNGYPVWGESSDSNESLPAVVQQNDKISSEEVGRLVQLASSSGRSLREVLLHEGTLSERQLFLTERKRVQQVVLGSFSGARGSFVFKPGDTFFEKVGVFEVNPVRCLGEVVQRYFSANELAPDVQFHSGSYLVRGARYRQLFPYLKLPSSLEGLGEVLRRGAKIDELFVTYSDAPGDILRMTWLMLKLGIAEPRKTDPSPRPEPLGAEPTHLSQATYGEPGSPMGDRGTAAMDSASRDVLHDYLTLMEADFFTVLGLEQTASPTEIAAAYEDRMRRYRLTRLPPAASTDVRAKAKELLVRLLDAYETLSDTATREMYLLELEVGKR